MDQNQSDVYLIFEDGEPIFQGSKQDTLHQLTQLSKSSKDLGFDFERIIAVFKKIEIKSKLVFDLD